MAAVRQWHLTSQDRMVIITVMDSMAELAIRFVEVLKTVLF